MAKVMVTITADQAPTLDELVERYSLTNDEIDADFGVIEVAAGVFTCLVDEAVAGRITGDDEWDTAGPYSNPRIAPFGPPEE